MYVFGWTFLWFLTDLDICGYLWRMLLWLYFPLLQTEVYYVSLLSSCIRHFRFCFFFIFYVVHSVTIFLLLLLLLTMKIIYYASLHPFQLIEANKTFLHKLNEKKTATYYVSLLLNFSWKSILISIDRKTKEKVIFNQYQCYFWANKTIHCFMNRLLLIYSKTSFPQFMVLFTLHYLLNNKIQRYCSKYMTMSSIYNTKSHFMTCQRNK